MGTTAKMILMTITTSKSELISGRELQFLGQSHGSKRLWGGPLRSTVGGERGCSWSCSLSATMEVDTTLNTRSRRNETEATIVYWEYIGIMEREMETTTARARSGG